MLSHRARRSDRIAQLAVILSLKTFVRLHSAANKKFKQNPFFFSQTQVVTTFRDAAGIL